MVKAKAMIKDNNFEPHEIQSFLETQSDSLYNPYTEKAIQWNPEKSVLYFESPYNDDLESDDESKFTEMKLNL